jgi:hypothetical protein
MGQQHFLIDSNVVIDFLAGRLPQNGMTFMNGVVNSIPVISVITKIEVLGFTAPAEHYKLLQDFVGASIVLDITDEIANRTIELRKSMRIKTPDAIIAATALELNLTLITRNVSDFRSIKQLQIIDLWDLPKA